MSESSSGPSPEGLRKAAQELDNIAEEIQREIKAIEDSHKKIGAMTPKIQHLVAGSTSKIPDQAIQQLGKAEKAAKSALGTLTNSMKKAKALAAEAREKAKKLEEEQRQKEQQARRSRS